MEVLQTSALPLGYVALSPILAYSRGAVKALDSGSGSCYHDCDPISSRCIVVTLSTPHRRRCGALSSLSRWRGEREDLDDDRICSERRRKSWGAAGRRAAGAD